eukprot:1157568-Pelagomonas_calceolata.AAC.3
MRQLQKFPCQVEREEQVMWQGSRARRWGRDNENLMWWSTWGGAPGLTKLWRVWVRRRWNDRSTG